MDHDSREKRKEFLKKGLFEEFLEENFEDPENSDILIEKQSKPDKKKGPQI